MALKYHLVQRLDKSKDAAAGSKLYYGQIRAQQTRGEIIGNRCPLAASQHTEVTEIAHLDHFAVFQMLAHNV